MMRRATLLVPVLAALLLIPASWLLAQDPQMTLDSPELGPHRRPLVVFPHARHENAVGECSRCHHNNCDTQGKCSECHKAKADGNPVPLKTAFHRLCKSCHEETARKGPAAPPVMCGQCHK